MNIEKNFMEIKFKALSVNESFARVVVSSFALQLNPTLEEINEIKTAVSEAVTNCVVHAYPTKDKGDVTITCKIVDDAIEIEVKDNGVGIENIQKALEPFYTTRPEQERSGMGFAVMESFMDSVEVKNNVNSNGLIVTMKKQIKQQITEAVCD